MRSRNAKAVHWRRVTAGVLAGSGSLWVANGAWGDVITPTAIWASSYYSSLQNPINLINNSGLNTSSGNVLNYTHATDSDANYMWHAGAGQGTGGNAPNVNNQYLVLDLGANYDLSAAYIWQMVQPNLLSRGVKEFAIYASSSAPNITTPPATYDISGFTQILGTSTLAMGTGPSSNPNPATTQTFELTNATNVRQVYIDIISAWSGATNEYVGLSEIKFEGLLTGTEPPPPAEQFYWASATNGAWQSAGSWSPSGPPTASDDATFNVDGTYTVTLNSNTSVRTLNISAGTVTFDGPLHRQLAAETINITGGKVIMPGYRHGGPGGTYQIGTTSAFNFTGGTIRFEVAGYDYDPAFGTHIVADETYYNTRVVSGIAGSSDRPIVELANGAEFTGHLYTGNLSDWSVLIGINGGKGGVVVDGVSPLGTRSRVSSSGGGAGYIVIGGGGMHINGQFVPGDGTLEIYNGADANSGKIYIGTGGGVGAVVVDGAGSTLDARFGDIYVGYNVTNNPGGSGSLTVSNGGLAKMYYGGLNIGRGGGATGSVIIDNASILAHDGYGVHVGYGGTGSLTIRNGGLLQATGASSIGNSDGYRAVGTGTVLVEGPGSTLLVGNLYVGYGYTSYSWIAGDGTLTITDGGLVESNATVYIGDDEARGTIHVGKTDGSDIAAPMLKATNLLVGDPYTERAILNVNPAGVVELSGKLYSQITSLNGATIKVNLAGGSVKASTVELATASVMNWTGGTLWLTGGTGSTSFVGSNTNTLTVPASGLLKGSTTLNGRLTVLGTISPGDEDEAIATFATRNLTIGSTGVNGTFAADIDLTNGTADLLDVTGTVNLANATLSLSLLGVPEEFTGPVTFLLVANDGTDAVQGTFANIDLGSLASQFNYTIDYAFSGTAINGVGTGNDIAITLVPEPATALLAIPAALMTLRRRRSGR